MDILFNQGWFIQTLIEYILENIIDENLDENLGYIITQLNRKCYYFGIKNSIFKIEAHSFSWAKPYYKKYDFSNFAEMQNNLLKITQENDMNDNYDMNDNGYGNGNPIVFSAYRNYKMRSGSIYILVFYFENVDFNCRKTYND